MRNVYVVQSKLFSNLLEKKRNAYEFLISTETKRWMLHVNIIIASLMTHLLLPKIWNLFDRHPFLSLITLIHYVIGEWQRKKKLSFIREIVQRIFVVVPFGITSAAFIIIIIFKKKFSN